MTPLTLIAAVTENGVIGRANTMPWHMPSDLALFRRLTLGCPLIIGRKNFDAIGRPLPKRLNIIVSRTVRNLAGCVTTTGFEEALAVAHAEALRTGGTTIMVAGGGEIYRRAMPLATRLLISHYHAHVDGDVTFPAIAPEQWQKVREEPQPKGDKDDFTFTLTEYRRTSA